MFCCGGGDESKAKKGGARDAGVVGDDGSYELGKDHADYLEKSQAKTQAKNDAIKAAYEQKQSGGSDEHKATARFWFEFQSKVAERLEESRQIGKTEDKKEGEEAPDPKAAHDKFIKEVNFELEEPHMKMWAAYSSETANGDRKIDKEASMRFFDDLVNTSHDMALHSCEDYSRYCLRFTAQQDSAMQESRKEFADKAEAAGLKNCKVAALDNAAAAATKDSFAILEKAVAAAKEVEADTKEAEEKLTALKTEKEEADKKAADKAAADTAKKAEAKEKKQAKMTDEEKAKADANEEKEKEQVDKKAADAKAKTDEAEGKLKTAMEEAKEDVEKMKEALEEAKKDSSNPDTAAAAEKVAELEQAAADKEAKESARSAADENWLLKLNSHIDDVIHESAEKYEANTFTQQKVAFGVFFKDENGPDKPEFELERDNLIKVMTVGTAEEGLDGFVQSMGFKVMEAECLEELKKMNEEKKEES